MFSFSRASAFIVLLGTAGIIRAADPVAVSTSVATTVAELPVDDLPPVSLEGKIIVIDAGHATKNLQGEIINPGAKSKYGSVLERDVTLAVAVQLKPLLEAKGARVYLTRTQDNPWRYHLTRESDNRSRAIFANVMKADAYVRLHCDWNRRKKFEGYTNYYFRWGSRDLAKSVRTAMAKTLPQQHDNGVKRKSFVSVTAKMPTVLVEMGVLSNKNEAKQLENANFQARVAQAISLGVIEYFRNPGHFVTNS